MSSGCHSELPIASFHICSNFSQHSKGTTTPYDGYADALCMRLNSHVCFVFNMGPLGETNLPSALQRFELCRSRRQDLILIYSKPDCHLCEEAKFILKKLKLDFQEINIEQDAEAFEKYRYEIPVVFLDDVKISKGRLDEGKLKTALKRRLKPSLNNAG
jgi:glutaredoxin